MTMLQPVRRPRVFDMPGIYRIQVGACLPESWSDILGGMTVTVYRVSDEECVTTLTGILPDQVALAGVLETINSYRLPLLSVRRSEIDRPARARTDVG